MDECINCQRSLRGEVVIHKWERGDNSEAFVVCPGCRTENILWGTEGD